MFGRSLFVFLSFFFWPLCCLLEEFEDTEEVIRICKSKDRQNNGRKKKFKRTNNDLQNITHTTKDRETRTPQKTGIELRCSGRVSSSCSTNGTHRVTLVTNAMIIHEYGRTGKCLQQVEHICGHLLHRYL